MLKQLVVLSVILAVVYAGNYTWGNRQYNDRLLTREFARKSSSWLKVVTMDVIFPNKTTVSVE